MKAAQQDRITIHWAVLIVLLTAFLSFSIEDVFSAFDLSLRLPVAMFLPVFCVWMASRIGPFAARPLWLAAPVLLLYFGFDFDSVSLSLGAGLYYFVILLAVTIAAVDAFQSGPARTTVGKIKAILLGLLVGLGFVDLYLVVEFTYEHSAALSTGGAPVVAAAAFFAVLNKYISWKAALGGLMALAALSYVLPLFGDVEHAVFEDHEGEFLELYYEATLIFALPDWNQLLGFGVPAVIFAPALNNFLKGKSKTDRQSGTVFALAAAAVLLVFPAAQSSLGHIQDDLIDRREAAAETAHNGGGKGLAVRPMLIQDEAGEDEIIVITGTRAGPPADAFFLDECWVLLGGIILLLTYRWRRPRALVLGFTALLIASFFGRYAAGRALAEREIYVTSFLQNTELLTLTVTVLWVYAWIGESLAARQENGGGAR